jgi:DUF1365 family protein
MTPASCLYEGVVQHRRRTPVVHEFAYRLFMLYLDLEELPTLFSRRWLWSAHGGNLAWFRRRDHFGPPAEPLDQCVRRLVEAKTGVRPSGPIRLLTHLRYAGFAINPISLYYCFDENEQLASVVAEVTNTPWGERHLYVLDAAEARDGVVRTSTTKRLHVSPFLTMDYAYHFRLTTPGRSLTIRVSNESLETLQARPVFDATAVFHRHALTGGALARVLCRYPLMTAKVALAIYWQALVLWRKGAPYVPHPKNGRPADEAALALGRAADSSPSLSLGSDAERQEAFS